MSAETDFKEGAEPEGAGTPAEATAGEGNAQEASAAPAKAAPPEGQEPSKPKEPWEGYKSDMDESALRKAQYHADKMITRQGQELARLKSIQAGVQARTGVASQGAPPAPTATQAESEDVDWAALAIDDPAEFNRRMNERDAAPAAPAQPAQPQPSANPEAAAYVELQLNALRTNMIVENEEFKAIAPQVDAFLNQPENRWMWTVPNPYELGMMYVKAATSSEEAKAALAEAEQRGAEQQKANREAEERAATMGGSVASHDASGPSEAERIAGARGGGDISQHVEWE